MHPIFVRLRHRLDRAKEELARIDAAIQLFDNLPASDTVIWAQRSSLAAGIEAVYTEIENVLKTIAAEIDGYVPTGDDWHAKLLETMALEIPEVRPAVLSLSAHESLDKLRRFRHLVRNRYAIELHDAGIDENLLTAKTMLPAFETDLTHFIQVMSENAEPNDNE